jgi:hypothetical protein
LKIGTASLQPLKSRPRLQLPKVLEDLKVVAAASEDVSADVKLTHCAEVKVTHLGDDGGFLAVDVDPGASSGDTCDGPQGRRDQGDSPAAGLFAQHRQAVRA